ncbi:GNAT family N-acetyltransferase [Corynebacterium sp. Q4381]|uniref:N-acetylglutamate synthase, CG3035 family n=1 Tax=Corynebacterium sp. Marseille-Q4381 TaxID=3121597 RepID=UPI002FE5C047
MPRVFRSDPVAVGDRVVVRQRRGELASDVIGFVESVDPLVIRRGDELVQIGELHIMKKLSPRTVRNSDIRAIETATARAFPGQEQLMVGGWLVRAGSEIAERSNSATPIGHSAGFNPVPIAEIAEFYRVREMPVQLLIPERIGKPALKLVEREGWVLGSEILVMSAALADIPAPEMDPHVRVDTAPDDEWLALYHYRGQDLPAEAVLDLAQSIDGVIGFARYVVNGETVAVTRATITESGDGTRWLGFSAVEVADGWRRRGIGTAMCESVLAWGMSADPAADAAYLQVRASNTAGIGLYEKLGFTEHHRERYARFDGPLG